MARRSHQTEGWSGRGRSCSGCPGTAEQVAAWLAAPQLSSVRRFQALELLLCAPAIIVRRLRSEEFYTAAVLLLNTNCLAF